MPVNHYFSSFPISILVREPCSLMVLNTSCELWVWASLLTQAFGDQRGTSLKKCKLAGLHEQNEKGVG